MSSPIDKLRDWPVIFSASVSSLALLDNLALAFGSEVDRGGLLAWDWPAVGLGARCVVTGGLALAKVVKFKLPMKMADIKMDRRFDITYSTAR